ncbi:carbohydrate-binding module family 1 protein [Macrolepiota fuliginosa MF-IS2]|uniref:AA9 family lytic polysaccharide monooxygenase n=1 Tax=Macrolepiota fuliginosa MF-IS2 TaxID=1400762 RepID=A0A9P5XQ24_9AGAR|nr:carbohydrate-binding module family 1 protein [Macrolepiota fuliginosa MF-IS2]
MKTSIFAASLASLLSVASAHTIFQELWVNGVSQGHMNGIRVPDYDGPITDVTSNDLICNGGINPYHTPISTTVIDVPAGAQVTAEFHHTLTGADSSDAADPIDASHHGPILAYLAKIPDATQSDVTGLKWFKVYHDGLTSGTWAVDKLITNKGKVSFSIPSCIASGQYLLRVELIALHAAGSYPGAQLYMECAQINITGGSGSASPATYSIPGIYKSTDPGITVNIYSGLTNYVIPGPDVFSCSGSAATTPAPTTPATTSTTKTTTTSTTTSTTSTPATTSSSSSSGTVAQYGQCGGSGYTGPTACASGFTCTAVNDYYYQCL